ncbi:endopeptidase La [Marinicella sp. S1101]|uniref:endopeptidase La n=1 Tax=Marinicella marina TaxID=2996016 RepID=UPI0022610191|nr:endopeptidase La [Marinicella marina]MCX7554721.1 endopeptidase La [Marinicella marina]MDJ1141463.1 endopeptidase La [Marinicella marina]
MTNPQEKASVLPLRDVVIFPGMVVPLFVGREKSVLALESAMKTNSPVVLVAQKQSEIDDPQADDVYEIGTLSSILQMVKLQDGTHKVLIEGKVRVQIKDLEDTDYFKANYTELRNADAVPDSEGTALRRALKERFKDYVRKHKKIPKEITNNISNIDNLSKLTDTIAAHLVIKHQEKQRLLEMLDEKERLEHILAMIEAELELIVMEKKIRGRVKGQIEKNQREYYLNEQMKAIKKELTDIDDSNSEFADLEKKIAETKLSDSAREKVDSEFKKLQMMSPMSAEATVVRNYLETILGLPWQQRSDLKLDLAYAKKVLDEDHYGLDEIKERILEYLAVQQRTPKMKGAIMCLVGPPGVGKTSLGKSIAKATNRKFSRFSLGGVSDESEIRGHRRTYIGSMPGRVIQNIAKTKKCNPVMILDELDKMSRDFRGDPAAALLEVLDPEQNSHFTDHYLEVDFDLSEVMFIATANSLNIPAPLRDRMEIIRIPGYTEEEKIEIAVRYLLPKQLKAHGLKKSEVKLSKAAIKDIVRYYTRESGVRNLEREIAKISRKAVKQLLTEKSLKSISVSVKNLNDYLGVRKVSFGVAEKADEVGIVTGLAWTEVGGDLLQIEAAVYPGNGKLNLTGHLGNVMKESIQAALSVVKSRAALFGVDVSKFSKHDIHVHVPEGATPKDGPSAGIGMCTALVSALSNNPVKSAIAMTGEITLRGRVLAIGGLKEKLLAALRGGIKTVIIPKENEKNLAEMPEQITKNLKIIPVQWIDEVLTLALSQKIKHIETIDEPIETKSKDVEVINNDTNINNEKSH